MMATILLCDQYSIQADVVVMTYYPFIWPIEHSSRCGSDGLLSFIMTNIAFKQIWKWCPTILYYDQYSIQADVEVMAYYPFIWLI